jgi:2-polyprenyl-6-hydroxyphenyl methylase/3-demethylubiquinone-9 3-methyltransferase
VPGGGRARLLSAPSRAQPVRASEPGALAIVSTPYHGYWKNLALSLVPGAWDRHHDPLWDHGHIKFWSRRTLRALLIRAGFNAVRFERLGRIPTLAKSMIAVARS